MVNGATAVEDSAGWCGWRQARRATGVLYQGEGEIIGPVGNGLTGLVAQTAEIGDGHPGGAQPLGWRYGIDD